MNVCSELKTTKSKMDSQTKQVSEYATRMDDYDKKFEENSRKFGTLLAVRVQHSHTHYSDLCFVYFSKGDI